MFFYSTWNVLNMQHITQIRKDGIIETSPVVTMKYRKISSISRTKSQSLNVSCILAQLSALNPLKPGVELRMKM